jgi:hypothetical protein
MEEAGSLRRGWGDDVDPGRSKTARWTAWACACFAAAAQQSKRIANNSWKDTATAAAAAAAAAGREAAQRDHGGGGVAGGGSGGGHVRAMRCDGAILYFTYE